MLRTCLTLALLAFFLIPSTHGQSVASYTVEFVATWSAQTHPQGFPGNPHFSGLIGGTHGETVGFWLRGDLASEGIERMAETGSKSALQSEVQTAIDQGSAHSVLSGGGIGRSPNSVSLDFEITSEYPLVTLVSMLAPSPDWFVGVHDLPLLVDGTWVEELDIPLVVYDAGTDSGPEYTSPNSDTDPPQPIATLTTVPFDQDGVVGQFRFRLKSVTANSHDLPRTLQLSKPYPNPTSSSVQLDILDEAEGTLSLTITNLTGQVVRRLAFPLTGRVGTIDLDVSDLTPGVYILESIAGERSRVDSLVVVR
jgi:hypothetical protein